MTHHCTIFYGTYSIETDVENCNAYYKGKQIHLYDSDEECMECFYGVECRHTTFLDGQLASHTYKNMACDFRKVSISGNT